jgi:hypothetical protein
MHPMNKRFVPLVILMAAVFLLSGCGAIFPAPLPTPLPPEMIGTEVVETSAALAAQTAQNMPAPSDTSRPSRTPRPSETPRPTHTPSITPSPTIPFVVHVPILYKTAVPTETPYESPTSLQEPGITQPPRPTAIPVGGASVYTQTPPNGTIFSPGAHFKASWLFTNDTNLMWGMHEVDFIYWEGERMYAPDNNIIDLPKDVFPNGKVTISVNMIAPKDPGTYSVTYMLHEGARHYIKVTLTIIVQ